MTTDFLLLVYEQEHMKHLYLLTTDTTTVKMEILIMMTLAMIRIEVKTLFTVQTDNGHLSFGDKVG